MYECSVPLCVVLHFFAGQAVEATPAEGFSSTMVYGASVAPFASLTFVK